MSKFFQYLRWEFERDQSLFFISSCLNLMIFSWCWIWQKEGIFAPESIFVPWPTLEGSALSWLPSIRYWILKLSPLLFISSGLAVILFAFRRALTLSWILLFLSVLYVSALILTDYQLNNLYLFWLIALCTFILFSPNRIQVLQVLAISFWIMLSWSWMFSEWMNGYWFIEKMNLHPKLGEWAAATFCLILAIAPVFLFFKKSSPFWTSFFLLLLAFALLYQKEGFVAAGPQVFLLLFFAIQRWEQFKKAGDFVYQSYIHPEPSRLWTGLALILFWTPQAMPHLLQQPHKFAQLIEGLRIKVPQNSETICEAEVFAHYKEGTKRLIFPAVKETSSCNPYYYFIAARSLCEQLQKASHFNYLSFYFFGWDEDKETILKTDKTCNDNFFFKDLEGV